MKTKIKVVLGYFISASVLTFSAIISFINLQEIINRASGRYTFYSQRASLTDGEAVFYFSCWTVLFLFVSYLTIKSLIRRRFENAIISSIFLFLFIVLSTYVDRFFYHELV